MNPTPRRLCALSVSMSFAALFAASCVIDEVPIGADPEPVAGQAGAVASTGGAGGDGPGSGGADPGVAGTAPGSGGAAASCEAERASLVAFIGASKACGADADCRSFQVGCGVTETACTGDVYVNEGADPVQMEALRTSFTSCMGTDPSCAVCDMVSPEPVCRSGVCRPASFSCSDEESALRDFITANKDCSADADCTSFQAGCGVTEDSCTGTVYVSTSADPAQASTLASSYMSCMGDDSSCARCLRASPAAVCRDGQCMNGGMCLAAESALRQLIGENKSCEATEDCAMDYVGCRITEDECTGAVYFSASIDMAQFTELRNAYTGCMGNCVVCDRASPGPECVDGVCQRGSL